MVIQLHNDNYYFNIIRYNIKKQREKAGLTQQQLADKIGITMNYLAKIESKKMQSGFTIIILGRIADALNIDIRDLFEPINKENWKSNYKKEISIQFFRYFLKFLISNFIFYINAITPIFTLRLF